MHATIFRTVLLLLIILLLEIETTTAWSFRKPYNRTRQWSEMSRWLEELSPARSDKRNRTTKTVSSVTSSHLDSSAHPPSKRFVVVLVAFLHRLRAMFTVQVIRFTLVFHWEGWMLKYLPTPILLEIASLALSHPDSRWRLLQIVSTEIDQRVDNFRQNDKDFRDGIQIAIRHFTGKRSYRFGDITRTLLQKYAPMHVEIPKQDS